MPPGQVRFNRVPEKAPQKVPEKVPGGFGAEPDQVQQGSGEGSWEALAQSQVRLKRICGHLTHGNPAEVFPALGFAARFRKSCKHKKLWPLEIPHIYIYICMRLRKYNRDRGGSRAVCGNRSTSVHNMGGLFPTMSFGMRSVGIQAFFGLFGFVWQVRWKNQCHQMRRD